MTQSSVSPSLPSEKVEGSDGNIQPRKEAIAGKGMDFLINIYIFFSSSFCLIISTVFVSVHE